MKVALAPLVAGVLGGVVALAALAMPTPVLESMIMASGLPAIVSAAEPPLGLTARLLFALGSGGLVALFGWFGLSLLLTDRTIGFETPESHDFDAVATPVIRRADAHPDAPPRPPLLATRDLGRPFPDERPAIAPEPTIAMAASVTSIEPVEQPLPKDLDQPLSAFDPAAVPEVPMPAPVAPSPLRHTPRPPVFDETERFETFELTPPVRPMPSLVVEDPAPVAREEAITRPETEATVHALLERLERGVVRKTMAAAPVSVPVPAPRVERRSRPRGLEDTLVTLRNLAQRA
ncbi:hypothetical protein MZO42_13295 [Sphingomonas psychrotolerans]|uniref:Uncharacterized protein n=1 Tax=Sphingomonas psychrotolerans TaxID=1327635 RepID=A0ABU3N561_9SPHN|nr:hypothetical protein [Sphingomonas psychrotolerans]MDT8759675.1 hypothetical protein [Sphingomonas psychrotolerans]